MQDVPEDEYLTTTLCNRATEFIRVNKDKRWALYLTLFAVHTPLNPNKLHLSKYEAKPPGRLHNHVAMATMVQSVDDGVGKLRRTLDDLGLADDTAVIFFSDNGGYGPATDMAPLKGYKGCYYEGGIREPFFVKWPGVVKPGTKSAEPIIGVDLYPTLCAIGGARLPQQALDGRSLLPLLKGERRTFGQRPIFWHFPAYLQSYQVIDEQRDVLFRSRPCGVVRVGDWKLHEYFEDGGLELYNLKDDIGESRNLAKANPKKTTELHALMKQWRKEISAPVPTAKNPKFDAAAEAEAIKKALARRP